MVSIYDIARRANVSPSTVSRALQDHPRIGAKTKQRIQEIAKSMGYVPSTVAKSLYANRTWTIGLVLATIADPFMGGVVEGVEQTAIESGYNVILCTSQNKREREAAVIEMLEQRRVDGIIVIASHLFMRYAESVTRHHLPMVIINEQDPENNVHFVTVDDVQGARLAVEHLLSLGHRRIGYVGITNRPKSNSYRLQGYKNALAAAGIAFDPALVFTSDEIEDHAKRGERSVDTLVSGQATAVFCYNDTTAMGVLAACYRRGIVVPGQMSVIGFDDIEMAKYTIPALTTIRQPRFDLGRQALLMMLELLADQAPENQMLNGELVLRETTGPLLADGG